MSTITAYVMTSTPFYVQSLTPLLTQHAGITLDDPNALHGTTTIDGVTVTLETGLAALTGDAIHTWARQNATSTLVAERVDTATSHLVITTEADDPYQALTLTTRALHLVSRLQGAELLVLPWQELTTTPELWLADHDALGPDQPPVLTWFAVPTMWTDDNHTTSLAFTRGLTALGHPELNLPAAPWEPMQTRHLVRQVTANLLAQRAPIQPGTTFTLDTLDLTLVEHPDPITGDPAIAITPTH